MLAAALNGNGMLWKTSPAVTELEQVALRWLRQWCGLPEDWFGIIYDTASTSSMHAIAAARQAADPESRTRGTAPGLVVYTSEQAHSSIEKGAIAVGIGQDYVRKVPVDDEFRMRPDALQEPDRSRSRRRPAALLRRGHRRHHLHHQRRPGAAIADICERHGIWLHVDAAYAGSAAIAPGVPLGLRRLRARRFARHESRTSGCSLPWIAASSTRAGRTSCGARFR